MASQLFLAGLLLAFVACVHGQRCYTITNTGLRLTEPSCVGGSYSSCTEAPTNCSSSSYCVAGSTYHEVLGAGIRTWYKYCFSPSDTSISNIDCGATNYTCTSSGGSTGLSKCFECCTGALCNAGTPPGAASAITAMRPLAILLLISSALFFFTM